MIYVGVLGSTGRMGQTLVAALENHPRCRLSVAGTREDLKPLFESSDVIVDFTAPDALSTHVNLSLMHNKPLVVGTTGLQPPHTQLISSTAAHIPLVVSSNMSIGVNLLISFIQKTAGFLNESYDIEITDTHHRHKKDAPSGTALMFGEAAARGRGKSLDELHCEASREGERVKGAIGFAVQRGGMIIGDHAARFIDDEEIIEFSHRSLSRTLYAKGALHAAEWVIKQKPGLYSMVDVLGL